MFLSIYDLEDSSGTPLCSFGEGEHVIGRGSPLKCLDKRISRKHAQIEVAENAATITAKHQINPCFYRAAEGKHISILKYDLPVELNSGDRFGFFPDKYWFRIKLTSNSDATKSNNRESSADESLNTSHESERSDSDGRNQETTSLNNSISEGESVEIVSNVNGSSLNANNAEESFERTDNSSSNISNAESSIEVNENSALNLNTEGNDGTVNNCEHEDADLTDTNCVQDNAALMVNNSLKGEQSAQVNEDFSLNNSNGAETSGDRLEVSSSSNEANIANAEEIVDGVLHHVESIHSAETTMDVNECVPDISEDLLRALNANAESMQNGNTDNSFGQNLVNVRIKEEPVDDYSNVRVKQEINDEDTNQASTSNVAGGSSQNSYRDRCWYGDSCYRKNDEHRLKFSHPNDKDYDTDPEDSRPCCPYGANCYRRNKDHRKNFKHSRHTNTNQQGTTASPKKQTAPKNNKRKNKRSTDKDKDGDDGDGLSQSNIQNNKRRRNNKTLAESPLDDYDTNDPFIDDSSDEYQMDTDEDESDEDSQTQDI